MKILITGNMGYVGPVVVNQMRTAFHDAIIIGYDMGYFASCLTNADVLPETKLDAQVFGDVRTIPDSVLQDVDVVIHLAAISNDPMGTHFENVTLDINYKATIRIAKMAKQAGVRSFIFASSCSMYGIGENSFKAENSILNPLTAYARSKVFAEKELESLADENFTLTSLRFATACGMSDRLRLDLVLNDFAASAVASGKINILSDGTPWRPLIHVKDMAKAIEWAVTRDANNGGEFLAVNTGSNEWNFQVIELAEAVAEIIENTQISLSKDAGPDKRSFTVNFNLFKSLAPNHQPSYTIKQAIRELQKGLTAINFKNQDFKNSSLIRLKALTKLQESKRINDQLEWTCKKNKLSEKEIHQNS